MPHTIVANQLSKRSEVILASSAEDRKKLIAVLRITVERFHVDTKTSFIIKQYDKVISTHDQLALAIQSYNKLSLPTSQKQLKIDSLCYSCMNAHCRAKLYNSTKCKYYTTTRIINH